MSQYGLDSGACDVREAFVNGALRKPIKHILQKKVDQEVERHRGDD